MKKLNHILYIEDEHDIREVTKLTLEVLSEYKVHVCESGEEGLRYLADHMPDIVMLDVMMPKMDGPSTFKAIRALPQAKDIPIIFITAKAQEHEIQEFMAMGSIGVISKPFDALLLGGEVQALWDKHYG